MAIWPQMTSWSCQMLKWLKWLSLPSFSSSSVFNCSSNQQLRLFPGFMIKNIEVFCSSLPSKFIALTKLSKSSQFSYSAYNKPIAYSNLERIFCQTASLFPSWESVSSNNISRLKLEAIDRLELDVIDCLSLGDVIVTFLSSVISELIRLRF